MPVYVLPARDADTALVFRRGPSSWWHLLEWRLDPPSLTPGAWFYGTLYARRCDVSPDGTLLGYFALKSAPQDWPATYFAVSKVPWLNALAAWKTCGTWTWGCQFAPDRSLDIHASVEDAPFHGDYPYPVALRDMRSDWAEREVWNELKRGWARDSDSILRRQCPTGGGVSLVMIHRGEGWRPDYLLDRDGLLTPLPDAVWCDWDRRGRLLQGTRRRNLVITDCSGRQPRDVWRAALGGMRPHPAAAPEWAGNW